MERKHIPESENRLTILYALRGLGPATAMQLLQFLVENDLMNYFTMQLSLSDMQEQGHLTATPHPLGDLLTLTPEGEYAIESFAHRIPVSRRQLMDAQSPRWKEQFRTEQLTPADSFTLQDGRVCLRLRLLEGSTSLLDILLTLPKDTPPTFMFHTAEDPLVPVEQSIDFAQKCADHGVPVELHVFPFGPHGIGLGHEEVAPGASCWSDLLGKFLHHHGF
jgi:pimeloyl-ACP methyl ester carboxylesterase